MIVDTHMHVWRYPEHIVKESFFFGAPPKASEEQLKAVWDNPPERYIKAAEGVVDKALAVSMVGFGRTEGFEVSNNYIASVVKQFPKMYLGVGSVDPLMGVPAAVKEVERCVKELGFVGIKVSTPTQCFHLNDPQVYPIYARMQELNTVLQVHCGYIFAPLTRLKYADIIDVDDVAVDFPELKIQICHMGFYKYEDTIAVLQKNKNVYADLSLLCGLAGLDRNAIAWNRPTVEDSPYFEWLYPLLRALSAPTGYNVAEKLTFATDYPAQDPKTTVEIFKDTNQLLKERNLPTIPRATLDAMLSRNWKKLYSI